MQTKSTTATATPSPTVDRRQETGGIRLTWSRRNRVPLGGGDPGVNRPMLMIMNSLLYVCRRPAAIQTHHRAVHCSAVQTNTRGAEQDDHIWGTPLQGASTLTPLFHRWKRSDHVLPLVAKRLATTLRCISSTISGTIYCVHRDWLLFLRQT
jgi:hypothetical protein